MATTTSSLTPEERARKRTEEWQGFWWHVATFIVVNVFVWAIDWITGDGIQWAYWVTLPWFIGLAFHIAAYVIEIRGISEHKYEEFLQRERERDGASP